MKVLCNACEAAEAAVMCCADEAALCWACDERVHAANKLAGKHHRIPLVSASGAGASPSVPKCDICQESSGYFFCLEDRALLCRNCDTAIHTANPFVAAHQRFLLTGVQVGLESTEPSEPVEPESTMNQPNSGQVNWDSGLASMTGTLNNWSVMNGQQQQQYIESGPAKSVARRNTGLFSPNQASSANKIAPHGGVMGGDMSDWPLDEFFGFSELNNNNGFGFTEHGSSKVDSGKLGSSEGSPVYRSTDEEAEECLGQVPELSSWTVPDLPSPPTASGLHCQRNTDYFIDLYSLDNVAVSVPDISHSDHQNKYFTSGSRSKSRRRHY